MSTPDSGDDLLIHVDNVTAGYVPGVNILNSCSLELRRGELIGIIGPNGAGKTTLVRLLIGALAPDAGTLRLAAGLAPL